MTAEIPKMRKKKIEKATFFLIWLRIEWISLGENPIRINQDLLNRRESVGRCDLAAVDAIEGPVGNPPVNDNIDILVVFHRLRIVLEEMCELTIDNQIFVAVILGDGKTELAVGTWRESPC